MDERAIQRVILGRLLRRAICMPNFTPRGWWECDVAEITQAGYFREYEIKLTRSDFRADAEKWRRGSHKHDLLAAGHPGGPSSFFFVTPRDLLKPGDLPPWAGLIEIWESKRGWALFERRITPAPRRHREKAPKLKEQILTSSYYRYHDAINHRDRLIKELKSLKERQ